MKKRPSRWVQHLILSVIGLWGFISFIILAGEEDPLDPMPLGRFCLIKSLGLISLFLCFLTGKWADKKGLLPDEINDKNI